MKSRLDVFLNLSVSLTGFSRLYLGGTGVGSEYLATLDTIVPGDIVDRLLTTFESQPGDDQISAQVLNDETLGPVARNIIVMWYSGTWTPLPEDWCKANGHSPKDKGHVVSAAAYQSGLQWAAIAAHPAGALPPGFASWASPPLQMQAGGQQ